MKKIPMTNTSSLCLARKIKKLEKLKSLENIKERKSIIMKKRVFAILVTLSLIFSLAACASGKSGEQTAQTPSAAEGGETPRESAGGGREQPRG